MNQSRLDFKGHIVKKPHPIDAADVRMARAGLGLSMKDLARISSVSANTISRIEADYPANLSTLQVLRTTFEALGASFNDDGSVSISAEAVAKRRERLLSKRAAANEEDPD